MIKTLLAVSCLSPRWAKSSAWPKNLRTAARMVMRWPVQLHIAVFWAVFLNRLRSRYCRVPMFVRQRHNLLRTVCRRPGSTSVDHGGLKSTLQSQAKINRNLTPIIRSITLEQKVQCAGNARLFRLK
jgi:hypothetical protein